MPEKQFCTNAYQKFRVRNQPQPSVTVINDPTILLSENGLLFETKTLRHFEVLNIWCDTN